MKATTLRWHHMFLQVIWRDDMEQDGATTQDKRQADDMEQGDATH